MAYQSQFRKKLLSTMEKENLTIVEAAKQFAVGTMSVSRWKNNPEPDFKRNRLAQIVTWKS